MDREVDRKPDKRLKPYEAPTLRRCKLTKDEAVQLRASEDPMALLFELKPELKDGGFS